MKSKSSKSTKSTQSRSKVKPAPKPLQYTKVPKVVKRLAPGFGKPIGPEHRPPYIIPSNIRSHNFHCVANRLSSICALPLNPIVPVHSSPPDYVPDMQIDLPPHPALLESINRSTIEEAVGMMPQTFSGKSEFELQRFSIALTPPSFNSPLATSFL